MYNILISGNNEKFNTLLKNVINISNEIIKYNYTLHIFDSKSSLLSAIKEGIRCNLLIIDLDMDNDCECVSLFRTKYDNSVLVFYSEKNILEAHNLKYNPYRLITKTISRNKLELEISDIINEMMRYSKKNIYAHYRSNIIRLDLNEIIYIENAKRGSRIIIDLENEKNKLKIPFLTNKKLMDLTTEYSELIFIHNSYIVNINNVIGVINNDVIMKDKTMLSMSRKYRKQFIEKFDMR